MEEGSCGGHQNSATSAHLDLVAYFAPDPLHNVAVELDIRRKLPHDGVDEKVPARRGVATVRCLRRIDGDKAAMSYYFPGQLPLHRTDRLFRLFQSHFFRVGDEFDLEG